MATRLLLRKKKKKWPSFEALWLGFEWSSLKIKAWPGNPGQENHNTFLFAHSAHMFCVMVYQLLEVKKIHICYKTQRYAYIKLKSNRQIVWYWKMYQHIYIAREGYCVGYLYQCSVHTWTATKHHAHATLSVTALIRWH